MTPGPENGLALLTAVFPGTETDVIAHALKQARGDVQGASAILLEPPRGKRALDEWLGREPKRAKPRRAPTLVKGSSTQLPSAFDRLVPPVDLPPPAPTLSPLLLTTPAAVHKATDGRCTLIENVLPREDAARLYLSSVHDSLDGAGWETNKWTLFDREVESPHTTSFFVEGVRSGSGGGCDQLAFAEAAKYWYNGEQREAKVFNAEMDKARAVIGPLVRAVMHERTPESPLQWDGDWEPNVAAANCYRGKSQVSKFAICQSVLTRSVCRLALGRSVVSRALSHHRIPLPRRLTPVSSQTSRTRTPARQHRHGSSTSHPGDSAATQLAAHHARRHAGILQARNPRHHRRDGSVQAAQGVRVRRRPLG